MINVFFGDKLWDMYLGSIKFNSVGRGCVVFSKRLVPPLQTGNISSLGLLVLKAWVARTHCFFTESSTSAEKTIVAWKMLWGRRKGTCEFVCVVALRGTKSLEKVVCNVEFIPRYTIKYSKANKKFGIYCCFDIL